MTKGEIMLYIGIACIILAVILFIVRIIIEIVASKNNGREKIRSYPKGGLDSISEAVTELVDKDATELIDK